MEAYSTMELWAKVRDDDPEAFSALYERQWEQLYQTVYWKVYCQEDARDIVQDIFVQLWEKRRQIDITESVEGYLKVIARNSVLNFIKAKGIKKFHTAAAGNTMELSCDGTAAFIGEQELKALYDAEVSKLPDKMKTVFLLSREEDLSIEQIAGQLNLSPQTVKNQVSSALKKIRAGLEDYHQSAFCAFLLLSVNFFQKT